MQKVCIECGVILVASAESVYRMRCVTGGQCRKIEFQADSLIWLLQASARFGKSVGPRISSRATESMGPVDSLQLGSGVGDNWIFAAGRRMEHPTVSLFSGELVWFDISVRKAFIKMSNNKVFQTSLAYRYGKLLIRMSNYNVFAALLQLNVWESAYVIQMSNNNVF